MQSTVNATDYYAVLGIPRDADEKGIKKAYRKLAKTYHPDVNKDANAKDRFQAIQAAYEVLSTDKTRKIYDQYGQEGLELHAAGQDPAMAAGRAGYQWKSQEAAPSSGFSTRFQDFDLSDLFKHAHFRGTGPDMSARTAHVRGADTQYSVVVPFQTALNGGTMSVNVQSSDGRFESIEVKVPKGTSEGTKLRLKGKGHTSPFTQEPGDLILQLKLGSHPYFRREKLDVFIDVPINIAEAALGTRITIPTPHGDEIDLTIPPGSSHGRKLRLRGLGVENTQGERGDLYAIVSVEIPKSLSDDETLLLTSLRDKLKNPREERNWAA